MIQSSFQKVGKVTVSLFLVIAVVFSVFAVGMVPSFAAESTGVGLSSYCLNAYHNNWKYVWGGSTPGTVDCSGLIYSYNGVGGIRTDMLASSNEWGYVSNGVPRIHGLGLHMPGHVGVYVGNGLEVDARSSYYNMCYGSISNLRWKEWFKLKGVSYPTTGWVLYNGNSYYYENGEYIVNTTRRFNGVQYSFGSDGVSNIAPPASVYSHTDYSAPSVNRSSCRSYKNDGILRVGSNGNEVKKLQKDLKKDGYYTWEVTGYFGEYTDSCVKQFQKDMGLLVDGEVGPDTLKALRNYKTPKKEDVKVEPTQAPTYDTKDKKESNQVVEATDPVAEDVTSPEKSDANVESPTEGATDKATEPVSSEPATEATTAPPTEPPKVDKLAMGGEGSKVKKLQKRLTELRYYMGSVQGKFDKSTYDAMQAYFRASELKPVEEMTDEHFEILLSDAAVKSPEYSDLRLGYRGEDVAALQDLLVRAGYMTGGVSGIFDKKTEDAVKVAQANFALGVNGVADPALIGALKDQIDAEAKSVSELEKKACKASDENNLVKLDKKHVESKVNEQSKKDIISARSANALSTEGIAVRGQTPDSVKTFMWVAAVLFFVSALSLAVFTTQGGKKSHIINRYDHK